MSQNQEIISFPFPEHLSKYLWVKLKGVAVHETPEHFHKPLDIDLRSIHGRIIRLLLERVDYPGIKDIKQGFRLFVSIPKQARNHASIMRDGQCGELIIPQEAQEFIIDFYEEDFRSHLHTFICGYVHGNKARRYSVRQAIEHFMLTYDLLGTYTYEQIEKFYKRTDSPLKTSIYAKNSKASIIDQQKKPSKTLLDRKIKT